MLTWAELEPQYKAAGLSKKELYNLRRKHEKWARIHRERAERRAQAEATEKAYEEYRKSRCLDFFESSEFEAEAWRGFYEPPY